MRIVSLIASATEIVCALGLRDSLVGRSHECDTPEDVTTLPKLTAPKFDIGVSSRDIDRAVKRLVGDGLSVYDVDTAALRALNPDLIVTQDQCEVCAVSLKDVEAAICDWVGRPVRVISLRPNCLDDIWRDIAKIGEHTGSSVAAERLIDTLRQRVTAVPKPARRPRVLCVEWIDPPMTAGHWIPELIALAGGESLLAPTRGPSPYVSTEQIVAADPDVVIVAPCGFDLARTAAEMAPLDCNPLWRTLRAVREGRVFLADGNLYFNRPSPAVVETVEIIADILDVAARRNAPRRFGPDVWREWRRDVTATTAPQSSRHGAAQSPL